MFDLKKRVIDWEECFNSKEFEEEYYYNGELGNIYSRESTLFRLWCPVACKVIVKVYSTDGYNTEEKDDILFEQLMEIKDKGVWETIIEGDLKDKYYTYEIHFDNLCLSDKGDNLALVNYRYVEDGDILVFETSDMYGKASGTNGIRTMIVDLNDTNPSGWNEDEKPDFNKPTDAVIYELHIRDFSSDEDSGIKNKRQYMAFTENNTCNSNGDSTGVDHLKELGVTHVHLLPLQDYGSIDEGDMSRTNYNWGYDPLNYNTPEGSYASDASDGKIRIKEFKELVLALHKAGIRVIMDVVYNHTYDTFNSLFDRTVPNYYYRTSDGEYTNGSGCGNETASDRIMFRKYMIDSLKFWAREYHIDGFRFDLMAVHDIETMNMIRDAIDEIDKSILLYGEGWRGGESKLDFNKAAFKDNARKINNIAMFNDDGRDAVKGSVFIADNSGYATGAMYKDNSICEDRDELINNIKFMLAGSGKHPQVKTVELEEKTKTNVYAWADKPSKVINYVSAHDNWTLWDKILISHKGENLENLIKMDKLSMAIVMLSQGIPFIHAGDEFLRSKENSKCKLGYDDNSYMSGDKVNSIKWNDKTRYKEVFNYYKGLIEYRKANSLLRMDNREDINNRVEFEDNGKGVIICKIKDVNNEYKMFNIFNGTNEEHIIALPDSKKWGIYINGLVAGTSTIAEISDSVTVSPISAMSLIKME